MHRSLLALALAGAAISASAQLSAPNPDWKEVEAPPPPPVRTSGLIPLEMQGTSRRFGVDPASISVGTDGVVRYVVVAASPTGTVNALYEGIRCSSSEMKVYARHNPDSGWVAATRSEWQPLRNNASARHSLRIASTGACFGTAPNGPPVQITRDLRSPEADRFLKNGAVR